MLKSLAAALGVPVAPDRPDQGAPANYAPFGTTDGSNLHGLTTPGGDFGTVSRGEPVIQELDAAAQLAARLTEETWRLEIAADPFATMPHAAAAAAVATERTVAGGNAVDVAGLRELAKTDGVSVLKAMQCLNVAAPLGQGLWTGVPLAAVLRKFCGPMENVRRINFWGYHNDDPAQKFCSSVSYTECFEPVPGEPPVLLAFELNGWPVSLGRGGPVRMVVPYAHGFKSVKWLTHISLTNDYRVADTYASLDGMNDPASFLKTAAYITPGPATLPHGQPLVLAGTVVSGRTPLLHVEHWVRRVEPTEATGKLPPLPDDAPELLAAPWRPCELQPPPVDWAAALSNGASVERLHGFDTVSGSPTEWPMRFGYAGFTATITGLEPGEYEVRARAVDVAGNAQPQPRPQQKSGKNAIECRRVIVL